MRVQTATDVGMALRERRRQLGLTQEHVAALADVGRPWLIAVEAGHKRAELDKVLRLLAVLKLTLDLSPVPPVGDESVDLDALLAERTPACRRRR
jgi:HTH-type transcriptional regulator/antitoxin HipB